MQLHVIHEDLLGRSGHDLWPQVLEKLYTQVTGEPMPPVERDGGKPRFAYGPWHFSVTHTKNHLLCALCDVPVGIDGEELGRRVPEKLAKRVLSQGEFSQYAGAQDKHRAFLTFWVLKEARAKCSGRGIRYPEDETNFSLTDSRVWESHGCLVAVVTEEDYAI